jgi:hypothetical protein
MKIFILLFVLVTISSNAFAWKAAHTGKCTDAELKSTDPTYLDFSGNCLKSAKIIKKAPVKTI